MLELFPGTNSLQAQSSKNLQFTSSVTTSWCRNINLLPIDYGFRPRLRGRLTLRRLALRRIQQCLRITFTGLQNAPLPNYKVIVKASVNDLSPVTFSVQDLLIRPVSCYAFFKGWLLLSQPPGCLGVPTPFHT